MGRDWPRNVAANPDVVLEIGDLRLSGRAQQVSEESERARIASLIANKYWAARIGSWLGFGPQGVFEVRVTGET